MTYGPTSRVSSMQVLDIFVFAHVLDTNGFGLLDFYEVIEEEFQGSMFMIYNMKLFSDHFPLKEEKRLIGMEQFPKSAQ